MHSISFIPQYTSTPGFGKQIWQDNCTNLLDKRLPAEDLAVVMAGTPDVSLTLDRKELSRETIRYFPGKEP